MRIILSHEQVDFDGVASQLAVSLLDPDAIPVLPRRINRNVRSFLTLYGPDLNFIEPEDLRGDPIEVSYLVDTQSMVSVKGMNVDTQFRVIDHHKQKSNLPTDWKITIDETGANTTILVEQLQSDFVKIDSLQATLLLLGIYEDTGSLTYTRTTSRDVRAAAYLLDQHASLAIVNEFLNQPLSKKQQEIYEYLIQHAKSQMIQGYSILVCSADAEDLNEELSSIAHKLRDTLDPDVLFMVTKIRGGVQIIGRSTTDKVDVSKIAKQFGGGGHTRASAALVKNHTVEEVQASIIQGLENTIEPQLTIKEIMSTRPRLISADTPVDQIASMMKRYGYEGFPVIEDGKVIGLTTRRAVDRALSHDLNLPAKSIMDAGTVTISPDATIDELQHRMITTGWGQIPVIDQEQKVIGIVTRTDLIKTFPQDHLNKKYLNLLPRLQDAIHPGQIRLLYEIAQLAYENNSAAYIVGGFVRDLLLNFPSTDFDIVVEGDAIQLAKSIQKKFGGRVTTHQRFGTAKWFLDKIKHQVSQSLRQPEHLENTFDPNVAAANLPDELDFISARTEFYTHPSALPTVERGSIKLDLHRRDFTINTLAMRLNGKNFGEMYDYWGGYHDLTKGIVKILHSLSFVDDPTRILRAIRYEQRYQFHLDERTESLLLEARPLINRVSGDRIRHEFNRIFMEEQPWKMMSRLHTLGVLTNIHPRLGWDTWHDDAFKQLHHLPSDIWEHHPQIQYKDYITFTCFILWLIRSTDEETVKISRRLKFPRPLKTSISHAQVLYRSTDKMIEMSNSDFTFFVQNYPPHVLDAVRITTSSDNLRTKIKTFATNWSKTQPRTDGHTLLDMGIKPGPIYQEILSRLRSAWLDDHISTVEQENNLLKQLVDQYSGSPDGKEDN